MDCNCTGMVATHAPAPALSGATIAWGALGAAGAALMLAALLWRVGWLPRWGAALAGYSRLRPQDESRHPARRRLLAIVEANPGIATETLREASGLNVGTMDYHLRRLERAQLVKSLTLGRSRTWWLAGARTPSDVAAARALASPARAALLARLRGPEGLTLHELARDSGLAKATVHEHLRVLTDAGLVRATGFGVAKRHRAVDAREAPRRTP